MKKIVSKNNSEIEPIIKRLDAMEKDQSISRFKIRNFELYGINLVKATFDSEKQIYLLKELRNGHIYEFDNIDLASIEIYEVLHDLKLTF